jgi:photosystem II stability/assembly factor-like uncharacterized protein
MNLRLIFSSLVVLSLGACGSFDSAETESPTADPFRKLKPARAEHFKWSYPDEAYDPSEVQAALNNVERWRASFASGARMTGGQWRLDGPTNIGGRLNFLRPTPGSSAEWWAGAAGGGLWKTSDGGNNWACVNEDMPHLASGDLAFHPTAGGVMWLATGDPQISSYPRLGSGVYKSTDGGSTWQPDGLDTLGILSRLLAVNVDGAPWLFAAAMGNPAIPSESRGVWRRPADAAAGDWEQVLQPGDSTGVTDLIAFEHPEAGNVLIASAWTRVRTSTVSVVTGPGCGLHRSLDGGATWEPLAHPWGDGNRGRIGLQAQDGMLWALVVGEDHQLDNIYRSADAGATWSAVIPAGAAPENALGGFGWYFSKLRVNPFNANDLTILGVELHNSLDGGQTWSLMNPDWWTYEVHADKHDLVWLGTNEAIIATDGGAYRTTNHGSTWTDIEDLPVSQFYHVTWNPHDPGQYTGGAQDNGTTTGSFEDLSGWTRDLGGDGFVAAFHPEDPFMRFAEYQYGGMRFSPTGPGESPQWQDFTIGIADGERIAWDAPYMLHPANPSKAWFGSQRVYKMQDAPWGMWEPTSQDLTYNEEPGLQWRSISALAGSPVDEEVVAVGTTDGRIWYTTDEGYNWNEMSVGLPGQFITSLLFHPDHPDSLLATVSGYRNAQYTPHIFRASLGGAWSPATGDLPHHPVNNIKVLRDSIWAIGSDAGAYLSMNSGASWAPIGNLPVVPIYDLAVDTIAGRLVAGTFGRSIWSFPLDSLLPAVPDTPDEVAALARPEFSVSPNPFRDELRLSPSAVSGEWVLRDAAGSVVARRRVETAGEVWSIPSGPSGFYILTLVSDDGGRATRKLVRER